MGDVCYNTTCGGCLGYVQDLIMFVCVVFKGMEHSLPYYHFQGPMSSTLWNPPFFIGATKTRSEHDDMFHVDCFYEFLHCRHVSVNIPGYRPHIVDFYIW